MAETQSATNGKHDINVKGNPIETVNLGDVDREVGTKLLDKANPIFRIQNATYQEIVFWLGLAVLGIILLIILGLGVYLFSRMPKTPVSNIDPANLTTAQVDAVSKTIDHYSKLTDVVVSSAKEIFDSFVARTLVPILTTIIGYILGTQYKQDSKKLNDSRNNQR